MMRRRTDEEIQAYLERAGPGADAPADWSAEDRARLGGYRLVFEALGEDPGYALAPGFADEVAARLTAGRKRSPWLEAVVAAALLAAAAAVYVPPAVAAWIQAAQAPDSGARAILEMVQTGRPDLVLGALVVLTVLALVDRAFRKILPTVRTA